MILCFYHNDMDGLMAASVVGGHKLAAGFTTGLDFLKKLYEDKKIAKE